MPIQHSAPARKTRSQTRTQAELQGPCEYGQEEEENSVEEEESDGTEGVPCPVGASQGTEGPTLDQSNKPVSHQSEPSSLDMTQIMANLQAALSSEA
ncbi:hypothetical protein O181_046517 [Austropuccinia psidii MF-1]|uniref:Uncharacterized protein n=1 Tax=Austropuccinia psidii MF-1 TaxID=1389203 RepID=A0A9Q3HJR6_9BASI|nr:hypothetical protein [Austropuccinia psidii MF-1]